MRRGFSTRTSKIFVKYFRLFSVLSCAFFLAVAFFSCSQFKNQEWDGQEIVHPEHVQFAAAADEYLRGRNFQGAVLVGRNAEILFAKGYGLCDAKKESSPPVTVNSVFETGSVSKQMTAAAVMQLAQKKKLSVEDPLSLYFPGYRHGDEITIKMLLNMRSGLTDCINEPDEFFIQIIICSQKS